MTRRVVADYQVAYPDPLVVRAGDVLSVGKEDSDYPGWVWCEDRNGKGGWVPDDCIELVGKFARARYDYAATELAATVGQELVVTREKRGWALCTNESGQSGWLPLANLDRKTKK